MTRKDFKEKIVERRIKLIQEVLESKGNDYAENSDQFRSFNLGSKFSLHETPDAVAWEFLVKHLQSVHQMVDDYEKKRKVPTEEYIDEKIGDCINYLILLEGLLKDKSIPGPLTTKLIYNLVE